MIILKNTVEKQIITAAGKGAKETWNIL